MICDFMTLGIRGVTMTNSSLLVILHRTGKGVVGKCLSKQENNQS